MELGALRWHAATEGSSVVAASCVCNCRRAFSHSGDLAKHRADQYLPPKQSKFCARS